MMGRSILKDEDLKAMKELWYFGDKLWFLEIYIYQLTPNAIVRFSIFIWAVNDFMPKLVVIIIVYGFIFIFLFELRLNVTPILKTSLLFNMFYMPWYFKNTKNS
ncbi:hypothetical protein ACJX0J_020292 [Zea mays]